jgi:hypothetical protein
MRYRNERLGKRCTYLAGWDSYRGWWINRHKYQNRAETRGRRSKNGGNEVMKIM